MLAQLRYKGHLGAACCQKGLALFVVVASNGCLLVLQVLVANDCHGTSAVAEELGQNRGYSDYAMEVVEGHELVEAAFVVDHGGYENDRREQSLT